jgi:hypothetical protein
MSRRHKTATTAPSPLSERRAGTAQAVPAPPTRDLVGGFITDRLAHGSGDMRLGHAATVLSQIGLSGPSIRVATLNATFSKAFRRFPGCRR